MQKPLIALLAALLLASMATTTASAETLNPNKIYEGKAYQFDNYVIELDKVYDYGQGNTTQTTVEMYLYEIDEQGELNRIDNSDRAGGIWVFKIGDGFDLQGGEVDEFTVEKISAGEATFTYVDSDKSEWVELEVSTSWETEFDQMLESAEKGTFIGRPNLEITKTVDKKNVRPGDFVTVTIQGKNVGSVAADDIVVKNPLDEGFQLEEWIVDSSMTPSTIPKGDTKTLLKYKLKAVGTGDKKLSSTEVDYGREADDKTYSSETASEPSVFIEPVEANLTATLTIEKPTVSTGGENEVRVLLESVGEKEVSDVVIKLDAPEGASFGEIQNDASEVTVEKIGNDPQITLGEAIGSGKEREILLSFSFDEPGTYPFTGEVDYTKGQFSGRSTKEFTNHAVTVNPTLTYTATHQPVYVYATPVVLVLAVIGWVLYRRQQYKF